MPPRVLAALLLVTACTAPALKNFSGGDYGDASTGASSGETAGTSSTGGGESTRGESSSSSTTETSSSSTTGGTAGQSESGAMSTGSGASSTSTGTSGDAPVCGDGVVAGEEECDDANGDDLDRCADDCTKNRWVFTTAATDHQGALGGVEGADSRCRQYALQSGRADDSWMTFIAWISDADHDVRDRLYPGRGRYVRTDNTIVVDIVDEFYSGMLAAPINIDEFGQPVAGAAITGTLPDGTAAPGTHCENWTSDSLLDNSAYTGSTSMTDGWWTMGNPDTNPKPCAGKARLYCIEGA